MPAMTPAPMTIPAPKELVLVGVGSRKDVDCGDVWVGNKIDCDALGKIAEAFVPLSLARNLSKCRIIWTYLVLEHYLQ